MMHLNLFNGKQHLFYLYDFERLHVDRQARAFYKYNGYYRSGVVYRNNVNKSFEGR